MKASTITGGNLDERDDGDDEAADAAGLSMRYLGYHDAAWRHPNVSADGASEVGHFLRCARAAERSLFDMMFFADGIGVRADDEPPGSLARSNRNVELDR